jgi:thiol-disulfide isomerase/thioredoxin
MRTVIVSLFACAALALAAEPAPPRPSPPFSILRADAQPLALASFRGKVVALVFILTGCSHCQDFTRALVPIANEYAPRGVQFLECAVNSDAAGTVEGFVQQFQPPFPVGFNTQAAVDEYLRRSILFTFYVPHVVFLDRNGMIVGDFEGESDFMKDAAANTRKELDKLLTAKAPAGKKTGSPAKTVGTASK